MKKSVAAFLIALGFVLHGVRAEKRNPLMAKEPLVWAGIDYSMIRLIGPSEFRVPDMIFPGMFDNGMRCIWMSELSCCQERLKSTWRLILAQ